MNIRTIAPFERHKKSQNAWYDGVLGQNVVETKGIEPSTS